MTLMAGARLIYLDLNLATGGQTRERTCVHGHAHAHTHTYGVDSLPVASAVAIFIIAISHMNSGVKHKERHSNIRLQMNEEM